MYETHKNLKKLARIWTGSTELDDVTLHYQQTQDPVAFSYIFDRVWSISLSVVNKFWGLTEEDKASFVTEELHRSLMDYNPGSGATVQNFYSIYLKRRMYAETKMLTHDKRKANSDVTSYEELAMNFEGRADNNLEVAELQLALRDERHLSEKELDYCQLIVKSTGNPLKDSDAATFLGISCSAVNQIRKRLAKKLAPSLLC